MNTKSVLLFASAFGSIAAALHASPRTSASYGILTDSVDNGGQRTSSAAYTNDASIGGITGISIVAAPAQIAKSGYLGQLYDITALVLNSAAPTVNETATLQLAAWQFLDDTSFLAVPATTVSWGVVSGPVTGISLTGLATAGTVYQNTAATMQGAFGGFTGSLNLTVLDTIPDNFGSYAGDGLPDNWQVGFFGQDNPLAAPGADPSGNGQNNLFKYTAGLNPLDPTSRFVVSIAPVAGQPEQQRILFSPVVSGRTYTVKFRLDLIAGTWATLTGTTQADNGTQRTVTDTDASDPQRFYCIEITKP